MGVSAVRIQDKDGKKKLSVVRSTSDPTKYGLVLVNPDGSKITGGVKGPASSVDGDVVLFDGNGGNVLKDSGVKLCEKQDVCNMVDTLVGADHCHYPTAKAVTDAMGCLGGGDMMTSVYDPCGCNGDAFDFDNFHNKPQSCDYDINGLGDSCGCKTYWDCKQDALTAGNNITISGTTISGDFNYAEPTTAATTATKCVCIPEITQLCVGQTIIVKPTITATNCATNIKLNSFDAYPVRFNNADLTSTTDGYVWGANQLTQFVFDGDYWHVVGKSYDANTTYTMNYQVDAGKYKAGVGNYAISRYVLAMEKDDGTWEKIVATNANYSTGTSKGVNTNGFRLGRVRYYNTTTVVANGALIGTNTMNSKAASVDLRYSTNCGGVTNWGEGDYIYLVGTIGNDGLFYLDTTTWWTNQLPSAKDGKVYIRLGLCLAAGGYTCSLLEEKPIFYYDNGIKVYVVADNKQDLLVSGTNIKTINGCDVLGSGDLCIAGGVTSVNGCTGDVCLNIPTDNCELGNGCGYITGISCNDVTSALGYTPYNNTNPCGYTTCTGTLTSGDLACYACCCDIPTDNCQLGNSCGYTTCTGTLNGGDLKTINGCCLVGSGDICIVGGGGDMLKSTYDPCGCNGDAFDYCNFHHTPTIPTDNCELGNGCGYITDSYHDSCKQDLLCAGNGIDITSNCISTTYIYGQSSTAGGTATKEVTISSITDLDVGQLIIVKPTITSTTNTTMKLKLNSFTAYNILYDGSSVTTSSVAGTVWRAYVPSIFVLDDASGTKYWRFVGHGIDNNTTYASMTTTEIDDGTCTCCRVITPANLKYAINHYADLSCYAQCCDIPTVPTDNCQLANGCGYTTCTGTLTSADIQCLAQCCDIPTVPTDNCQLANGCGYTTCIGTLTAETVLSGDTGCTYIIKVSNVAPTTETNQTITLIP